MTVSRLASIILLLCAASGAWGQSRRHESLTVVPAPGPVVLDGDLGEWDLSGSIDSAYDESLRPTFSVKIGAMYDDAALYLAAHFVDDSPMHNAHDPRVEPNGGWKGDCLQVRVSSDPKQPYPLASSNSDRICHLTIWFHTPSSEPVLQVQYGMDFHGTQLWIGKDAGIAFKQDADAKGYTIEGRIPWDRLHAAGGHPVAGDTVAMSIQPLWGDAAGSRNVLSYADVQRTTGFAYQSTDVWGKAIFAKAGHLSPADRPRTPDEAAAPLTLSLPLADANARLVSAAVFDARGRLVRSLPIVELPEGRAARPVEIAWNGADDEGRPLPAGAYEVRFLTHRGIGQKWITSLHNAGNPPWRTDDNRGSWGGDHGLPVAAAADGQRVYLGWEISEAGWSNIAVDPKLVSSEHAQKLWGAQQVLETGMQVEALATNGQFVFSGQDGAQWAHKNDEPRHCGVVLWEGASGKPVNFPFGQRILEVSTYPPPKDDAINLHGIAVRGDSLYCSLQLENRLLCFNWHTGQKISELAVKQPSGIAVEKDGSLLVLSENRLLRINPVSGDRVTLVEHGLSAPFGIALSSTGTIYVSDRGDAMQVKTFTPDGKPAGTIGKAGGRPALGAFDPDGMFNPAGITIDAQDNLWVTEQDWSPKRVSVWSRGGKLVGDLLGPGAYAVDGQADELHPELVNTHDVLFQVDYATGKTKTLATLIRAKAGELHESGGFMGRSLRFRHTHGHNYLVHGGMGTTIVYLQTDAGVGKPVAALGDWTHLLRFNLPAALLPQVPKEGGAFVWTDRNGDGLPQAQEFTVDAQPAQARGYWGPWVDEDLGVWSQRNNQVFYIPVKEWLPDGTPVYPAPAEVQPLFSAAAETIEHVMPSGDGGAFVIELTGGDGRGSGTRYAALSRYASDGARTWAYRKVWPDFALDAPLYKPGDVIGAMKFIGRAKVSEAVDLIGVNGYPGQFNLLTASGLWVAALCHDNRYGPKADETTVWPENFSGFLFRNKDNGRVYLIAGDTDTRIWEVTGLDTVQTASHPFTMSDTDNTLAVAAVEHASHPAASKQQAIAIRRATLKIDGTMQGWDLSQATHLEAGGGRAATIALAHDEANLYCAFDVLDDSPMRNSGKDPGLLFKTGDTCEVMLATDPHADPARKQPTAGDMRLLFSVMDDLTVCVAFEPVAAQKQPRTFSSPTGSENFDRVGVLSDAKVTLVRRAGGYVLQAAVPLKSIHFDPKSGTAVIGDVGVLFSDPGGSRTVLRAYHANQRTAITNDIPSEARLEPQYWGAVGIE